MEKMYYEKTFLYLRKYEIIVDQLHSGKCGRGFMYSILKCDYLIKYFLFIRAKKVSLYLFSNLIENGSKRQHLIAKSDILKVLTSTRLYQMFFVFCFVCQYLAITLYSLLGNSHLNTFCLPSRS